MEEEGFVVDAQGVTPDGAVIPKGDYLLKVVAAKATTGKTSGKKGVVFTVAPVTGEYRGIELEGQRVTFGNKGEKTLTWALRQLRAIGEVYEGDSVAIVPSRWVGRVFAAELDINEYEGQKRNQIVPWTTRPLTEEERRRVDQEAEQLESLPF